jgi:hypothetical protein
MEEKDGGSEIPPILFSSREDQKRQHKEGAIPEDSSANYYPTY